MAFPPYPAIRLSLPAHRRVARFLDAFKPDLVHVATEGPLGLVGRRYALRHGVPLVTSYHTHFPRYCRDYGVPVLEPAVWKWVAWFHRPAVMTHVPGSEALESLREHGVKATLWGRGVDTQKFHHRHRDPALRKRLGVADDEALVLHVGRLAAEKNLDVLVRAFAIAHEALGSRARFVIAGEGPGARTIADQLPFAIRLGFLDPARLSALYASADLVVLGAPVPACYEGRVLAEAFETVEPAVLSA